MLGRRAERRHQDAHEHFAEATFAVYAGLINCMAFDHARRRASGQDQGHDDVRATVEAAVQREKHAVRNVGLGMVFSHDYLRRFYAAAVHFTHRQLERQDIGEALDQRTASIAPEEAETTYRRLCDLLLDATINRRSFASDLLWRLHKRGIETDDLDFRGGLELSYLAEAITATEAAAEQGILWTGITAFPEPDVLPVHRALAAFCFECDGTVGLTWPDLDESLGTDADVAEGGRTDSHARNGADTKTCPDCAETIKHAANVCRYCGYRFASVA